MGYLGSQPATNFETVKKDRYTSITGTGITLSHSVSSVQDIIVWVNSVKQDYTSYSVNGTALTLGGSLVSSDITEVAYIGRTFQTVNPADASIGTAKLASDAVTAAKLNDDIISGQTALASEPADTDEFLVSDAGTLKRIDYSLIKGGGITVADQWRVTSNLSTNSNTFTTNLERVDNSSQAGMTDNQMSESSGIFTFPLTGIYLVGFNVMANANGAGDIRYAGGYIQITHNNSSYATAAEGYNGCNNHGQPYYFSSNMQTLVDVTDTSNVKVKFSISSSATVNFLGDTSSSQTHMTFIRLGDT